MIEREYENPTESELNKYYDNYYTEWKANVKRIQRLFHGILIDFRNILTGTQITRTHAKTKLQIIDYYTWFKMPLHHWRTAMYGHKNKYDCRGLSIFTIPQSDKYGGLGHSKITTDIEKNNMGREYEIVFSQMIDSILNGKSLNAKVWKKAKDRDVFQDYLDNNEDAINLVEIFLTHPDSNYRNEILGLSSQAISYEFLNKK